jgi:hypothetical protein
VKQGLTLEFEAEKSTCLNELDGRKPLVESIQQRSEEQRLYNVVWELTISKTPTWKRYLQMHLQGETDRFVGVMIRVCLKEVVKTYLMTSVSPPNSPPLFFSVCTSIVYGFMNWWYKYPRRA